MVLEARLMAGAPPTFDGNRELKVPLNLLISSFVYGLKVGFTVRVWRAEMICEQELPKVQEMLKNGIVGVPLTIGLGVVVVEVVVDVVEVSFT